MLQVAWGRQNVMLRSRGVGGGMSEFECSDQQTCQPKFFKTMNDLSPKSSGGTRISRPYNL